MAITPAGIVQIAIPFVWMGMVLALSFIETPLKFRAPGITRALGLGIGRLVFLALNIAEAVLAVVLTLCLLVSGALLGASANSAVLLALVVLLWLLLIFQAAILRPRMDARVRRIAAGEQLSRSNHHYFYVGAELVKLVTLPVLGVLLILNLAA